MPDPNFAIFLHSDDQSGKNSINVDIAIGVTTAVISILLVISVAYYCHKNKTKTECRVISRRCVPSEHLHRESNADVDDDAALMMTSQHGPSSQLSSPPSAPPPRPLQLQQPANNDRQYRGPEISSDLNKNTEDDPSGLFIA